jgi:hypothetical protein
MVTQHDTPKFSRPVWQAQVLRLTVFPVRPEIDIHQNWWSSLFGDSAEQVTTDKKQLLHQEKGALDGATLLLNTQPGRVDWQYVAPQELSDLIDAIPTLGPFSQALDRFTPTMTKWVSTDCPEVNRMAFGAVLLQPVGDRQTGYKVLSGCLRSVQIDPDTTDFLYQINRRKKSGSGIPEFLINRLTKWSVALMKLNLVDPSGKEMPSTEHFATRLELDISTPAVYPGTLPKEQLASLLDELVALGREISEKGESS